jgi:hypothetical protein
LLPTSTRLVEPFSSMMVPITGVEFDCACAGATKNKRQNAAREIPLIIVLFPFGRWLPNTMRLLSRPSIMSEGLTIRTSVGRQRDGGALVGVSARVGPDQLAALLAPDTAALGEDPGRANFRIIALAGSCRQDRPRWRCCRPQTARRRCLVGRFRPRRCRPACCPAASRHRR